MASDETITTTTQEHEPDDQPHHLLPHSGHSLSRLSVCSSSFTCGNEDDDDDNFYGGMGMSLARLSIENFDADGELSDSDKDPDCYSLPATPPRRRRPRLAIGKDYASENEAKKGAFRSRKIVRRRKVREEELSESSNLELEVQQRLSTSGHSSSGGNSPIASWRISSPGDHPRDVKARLKVWAQAVALVSASQSHNTSSN